MFRLLGFDVRVRPGFIVFMLLIVVIYGNDFGLWLAASLTVFTLIHELGHAVAARRTGANADISLDFLAGYTSFVPTRPLSRRERALISFAGPGVHITAGVIALALLGVNPLDSDSVGRTAATAAIFWAGPVIGLFNLVPVLPLDGGHIAETGLEAIIGRRATRGMAIASIVITSSFAVWSVLDERRGFLLFSAFLILAQIQLLGATSERRPKSAGGSIVAAADAERSAWRTGRPGILLPGQELSPWYRAHRARVGGRPDEAQRIILDDLAATGPRRWWPPDAAAPEQLRELVVLLPRPLPAGNPSSEYVLADVMLRSGDPVTAGTYAADHFSRTRSAASAVLVARAAGVIGDRDTAVKWLFAAAAANDATRFGVAEAIDHAIELERLRADPDVRQLRATLTSA